RFHTLTNDEFQLDENGTYTVAFDGDPSLTYPVDNPNFNFRQFRSNLVVRWEYNPGSTLFLVWTQERTGDDSRGEFSFRNDIDRLFETEATNIFLIKVSRWFSL
ncbi:MAG: DUF5916 domain-containing protein, partial [bacterium]